MRILCTAKDSHIFSIKNNSVFVILMFEILTKRLLTTSLVLNNWALESHTLLVGDCALQQKHLGYTSICKVAQIKLDFCLSAPFGHLTVKFSMITS